MQMRTVGGLAAGRSALGLTALAMDLSQAEEITALTQLLCGADAALITGTKHTIDGGLGI
jgi:hypothetical protein